MPKGSAGQSAMNNYLGYYQAHPQFDPGFTSTAPFHGDPFVDESAAQNVLNARRAYTSSNPTGGATAAPGAGLPSTSNPALFGSLTQPFTAAQFTASPGYQYQLQQGEQAIQNSAASRGGLVSGNALKALQANGIGLANQDWYNAQNAYLQQQQQRFNMLQTLSGSGQNAAANLGSFGSQVAGSIGANTIGAGNSAAAGSVAQAQVWSNLFNNQSFLSGIQSLFGGGTPAIADPLASIPTGTGTLDGASYSYFS
jgi:hypothetical protein